MTPTQEITEMSLPIPSRISLSPGKFFVSKRGDTWCCFSGQQINGQLIYNCVRLSDNFVGQYKEDGHYRFQTTGDDDDSEDNLIEEAAPASFSQGRQYNRLLDTLNTLVTKSGEALELVQAQTEDLAESNFRLEHVRSLLGRIANELEAGTLNTSAATLAQDALLWLANRELYEHKLGLPL